MDKIIAIVLAEWRVVNGAPIAFGAAVFVASVIIWFAMDWRYSGQLENEKSDKEHWKNLAEIYESRMGASAIPVSNAAYQLSPEQWAAFSAVANVPYGGDHEIFVTYAASCDDCGKFANDVVGRLEALGGWTLYGGGPGPDMGDFAVGINIRVQSTPAPKAATTIRAAF